MTKFYVTTNKKGEYYLTKKQPPTLMYVVLNAFGALATSEEAPSALFEEADDALDYIDYARSMLKMKGLYMREIQSTPMQIAWQDSFDLETAPKNKTQETPWLKKVLESTRIQLNTKTQQSGTVKNAELPKN